MAAFMFGAMDGDLYPFLSDNDEPSLSTDDHALLTPIYPDPNSIHAMEYPPMPQHFAHMQQPSQPVHYAPHSASNDPFVPTMMDLSMDMQGAASPAPIRTAMPALMRPASMQFAYAPQPLHPHHSQRPAQPPFHHSPTYSPTSTGDSDDAMRDAEGILNAPVKSLTEQEKKLRRRAQVAKSARKHRNRQKEELAQLRAQVQFLQEQMMLMRGQSTNAMEETDTTNHHRKQKKGERTAHLTLSPSTHRANTNANTMLHWFHHLPVDPLQRSSILQQIATKRAQFTPQYLDQNFRHPVVCPYFDIKLFSDGPDMEIKVIRAKTVPGFTHLEVADAAWNTVYDFHLKVPARYRSYVTCERLMEVDENTRYGRTITPILKNREDKTVVYVHTYLVVHRTVTEKTVQFTWETVGIDDLYPFTPSDTALWNDEVGCMVLESVTKPNGEVETLCRSIIHSTPPVNAITEPRGRVNEAFLTIFCRNAHVLEATAHHRLKTQYPDRIIKVEK